MGGGGGVGGGGRGYDSGIDITRETPGSFSRVHINASRIGR